MTEEPPPPESLRAAQVAQTREALLASGRRLFGEKGFAGTSVEDVAREAWVTTGALYHHFATKTALFEAVFETVHHELLEASANVGVGAPDAVEFIARALEAFLDAVLAPQVQRIIVTDAPAVLGQERFTELDERHSLGPMVASLEVAGERRARLRRFGDACPPALRCLDPGRDAHRRLRRSRLDS